MYLQEDSLGKNLAKLDDSGFEHPDYDTYDLPFCKIIDANFRKSDTWGLAFAYE